MAEQVDQQPCLFPIEELLNTQCALFLDQVKPKQRAMAAQWLRAIIDTAFNRGSEVTYEALKDWYENRTRYTLNRQPIADGITEFLHLQGKPEQDLTRTEIDDIRSVTELVNITITQPDLPRLRQLMMDFGEDQPISDCIPSLQRPRLTA